MKNIFLIFISCAVVISVLLNWSQSNDIKAVIKDKDSLSVSLKKVKADFKNKSRYADSVSAMNSILYSQKQLTEVMNFRDNVTKEMYKVGDRVLVLVDSTMAVVSDVIIGGGKYKYYVEYEVMRRDMSTAKFAPEMLMKHE